MQIAPWAFRSHAYNSLDLGTIFDAPARSRIHLGLQLPLRPTDSPSNPLTKQCHRPARPLFNGVPLSFKKRFWCQSVAVAVAAWTRPARLEGWEQQQPPRLPLPCSLIPFIESSRLHSEQEKGRTVLYSVFVYLYCLNPSQTANVCKRGRETGSLRVGAKLPPNSGPGGGFGVPHRCLPTLAAVPAADKPTKHLTNLLTGRYTWGKGAEAG